MEGLSWCHDAFCILECVPICSRSIYTQILSLIFLYMSISNLLDARTHIFSYYFQPYMHSLLTKWKIVGQSFSFLNYAQQATKRTVFRFMCLGLYGDDQHVDGQLTCPIIFRHSCHKQTDSTVTQAQILSVQQTFQWAVLQLFIYVYGYAQFHHIFISHYIQFRIPQSL